MVVVVPESVSGRAGCDPDGIPAELRMRPQWVTHFNKVPCCALEQRRTAEGASLYGKKIDYRDPANLAPFEDAWRASSALGASGAGFALLPDDPYTFIDLDHCVRDGGAIAPIVEHLLRRLGTYVEYSRNDGLHAVLKAKKPVQDCVFWLSDPTTKERFKVEIYDRHRFIAMTGRTPAGLPSDIRDAQEDLDALIAQLRGPRPGRSACAGPGRIPSEPGTVLPDEEVIRRAAALPDDAGRVFAHLIAHGSAQAHPSEDDWRLCCLLGQVSADAAQIERIARRTPLARDKWDDRRGEETWIAYTIRRALACCAQDEGADDAAGDDGPPPGALDDPSDLDEVAQLKRQVAQLRADCERWKRAYALLLATVLSLLRWKKAYERLRALLMTPALTESQKKALVAHLGRHGCTFGLPMPTVTWFTYLGDEDYASAPLSVDSYRTANAHFEAMGLFERERRDPPVQPPETARGQQDPHGATPRGGRAPGRPYDLWRPVGARVEQLAHDLETGAVPLDPRAEAEQEARREKERAQRRERERREKAEQEAREARLRQEAEARRQLAVERDRAQREAEERRQALEQARRVIAEHQRRSPAVLACRACGVTLDPEQLRCPECRERELADAHTALNGNVPINCGPGANGRAQDGHAPRSTDARGARAPDGSPQLCGNLPINAPPALGGGKEDDTRAPPAKGDYSEMFPLIPTGACSDCRQPLAGGKTYGRCERCRALAYAELGLEDPEQEVPF